MNQSAKMLSTISSPSTDTNFQESQATSRQANTTYNSYTPEAYDDVSRTTYAAPVAHLTPANILSSNPANGNPSSQLRNMESNSVGSSPPFGWQHTMHSNNPGYQAELSDNSHSSVTRSQQPTFTPSYHQPPMHPTEPASHIHTQGYSSAAQQKPDSFPSSAYSGIPQTNYMPPAPALVPSHINTASPPVHTLSDKSEFRSTALTNQVSYPAPPSSGNYPPSFGSQPYFPPAVNGLQPPMMPPSAGGSATYSEMDRSGKLFPPPLNSEPPLMPPQPTVSQMPPMNQDERYTSSTTYQSASYAASSHPRYPAATNFSMQSSNRVPYARPTNETTSTVFRTPGTVSTQSEWSRIKAPIGLLQEVHLFPSDTPDLPPKPVTSYPVNCDPDVLRCTLTNFPATSKLINQCRLPLGLVMHPFRDLNRLDTITSTVIARCRSCRTYINPFVQFVDSGRRWRCPVCFLSNTVPDDLFYDPATQSHGDPSRRPEIKSATVEFIAPPEYMLRPPQPATYLFCLDVSHAAIATGYLRLVCQRLLSSLNRMPGDSRRQIGFITFNSAIHFYKLCGDSMKLLICPDLDEPFLPDYEGLLNHIEDSSEALCDFLTHLPDTFADTDDVGNCLGSVLQIALKMVGGSGGRITVFNTSLPSVGVGALQQREEPSERTSIDVKHLGPAIDFYKSYALDCVTQHVAIDMFLLNSQYCDIATLSGASRFSSGTVYHYPDFYYPSDDSTEVRGGPDPNSLIQTAPVNKANMVPIEVERFRRDFDRYLTRRIGFEAVMRIRCTHGVTIHSFHGSCFVRSVDLMALPNVNPDAGYAVQLSLSENVDKYSTVCLQAAILYTSSRGDRRIRVHTLCLPVVHNPIEVFQGADQGAIACLIGKMAVDRAITSSLANAREGLTNAVGDMLSAYATATGITASNSASAYSMACPSNLRLLGLYICGLLRHTAFKVTTTVRIDDRSAALERIKSAPPDELLTLMYPRLYAVHSFVTKPIGSANLTLAQQAATLCLSDYGDAQVDQHSSQRQSNDGAVDSSPTSSTSFPSEDSEMSASCELEQLPGQLHLSSRNISRTGIYLLDTGDILFLLVGTAGNATTDTQNSGSEVLKQLLGISSPDELPAEGGPFELPPFLRATLAPEKAPSDREVPIARRRLASLIKLIRRRRPTNSALCCMRHDAPSPLRSRFLNAMVEDRTENAASYTEFLQMIQNVMKA